MLLANESEMTPRMFGLDFQLLFDSGLTLLAVFTLFFVLGHFYSIQQERFLKIERIVSLQILKQQKMIRKKHLN